MPDNECDQCTACESLFTIVRRRHHCRNCGRIFCSRCSANSIPIPDLGYEKKVRVCNLCFMYRINPFSSPISNDELSLSPASSANNVSNSNNVVSSKIHIQQTEASSIINLSNISDESQPSSSCQFNSVDVSRSFSSATVNNVLNSKMPLASSSGCVTAQR